MAFDGIFIHHLVKELEPLLLEGRIDKIYQLDRFTMVFHIRGNRTQHLLQFSVDPTHPYFCLDSDKATNPMEPPMFCMLMRKILIGGRITGFKQLGLERIIHMDMEVRNELGDKVSRRLIMEIMGKHSNLILVDPSTQPMTIIDSIKRVPEHLSRLRPMLPGSPYMEMTRGKHCLIDPDTDLAPPLPDSPLEAEVAAKWLVSKYEGMSPTLANVLFASLTGDGPFTGADVSSVVDILKHSLMHEAGRMPHPTAHILVDKSGVVVDLGVITNPTAEAQGLALHLTGSVNEAASRFFVRRNKQTQIRNKASQMRRMVSTRIEGLTNKLTKLHVEAQEATGAERYKELGELILANLYHIHSGDSEATVSDYYDPEAPDVTIHLDVRLSPTENANRYFRKYNKFKNARIEIDKQIDEATKELAYFENVYVSLEQSEDLQNLEEVEMELASLGYLKKRVDKFKKKKEKTAPFVYEVSSENGSYTVWAGKNNLQNDRLTLKDASNSDLWFHTKDLPGSHVILRCEGRTPDDVILMTVAEIAAYHSKGKLSSQVPVDFTHVRNVHKPSGAKHGMVIYVSQHTLYVTPDEGKVLSLRK